MGQVLHKKYFISIWGKGRRIRLHVDRSRRLLGGGGGYKKQRSCEELEISRVDLSIYSIIYGLPWWLKWWRVCLQYRRPRLDCWVGIPWRRDWLPTLVFWPGEFHKLYTPWVTKSQTQLLKLLLLQIFWSQSSLLDKHKKSIILFLKEHFTHFLVSMQCLSKPKIHCWRHVTSWF